MSDILISITLITFNQEKYIARAIESVLSQKTEYNYELIVYDDCSSDSTFSICERYYNANKDKIKLYKNEHNVGATRNQLNACKKCSGKYICHLEGDDYWIDEYKLQKQCDFLENHSEYIGVSHRDSVIDDKGNEYFISPKRFKRVINMNSFLKGYSYSGTSLMYRNYFENIDERYEEMATVKRNVGDLNYCIYILTLGNVYQLKDVMMAYMAYQSGNYNNVTNKADSAKQHIEIIEKLYEYYGDKYDFSRRQIEYLSICFFSRYMGNREAKSHAIDVFNTTKKMVQQSVLMRCYLSLPLFFIRNIFSYVQKKFIRSKTKVNCSTYE